MKDLPKWLQDEIKEISKDIYITRIEELRAGMSNCLELVRKMSKFSRSDITIMIYKEMQSEEPRWMVIDKLHARACKLRRLEQREELAICLKRK